MAWRDRIVDFRRIPASQLTPHPDNWRTHSTHQRGILETVLADIGFVGAIVARQCNDGTLQLIDGHMRVEAAGNEEVPVLVVDLTDAEGARALLTHDTLTLLATRDEARLDQLIDCARPGDDVVADALRALAEASHRLSEPTSAAPPRDLIAPELFQVVVECNSEEAQQQLYVRLKKEGLPCRVLTL